MSKSERQSRPRGPWWPIVEAWKRDVLLEMKRQGVTKAELARRIRCKPTALSNLFGPATKLSRLVFAIHGVLDLPRPRAVNWCDLELALLLDSWAQLSVPDRVEIVAVARLKTRRRKPV